MPSKSCRPEGATWISPYIIVQDVDSAVAFYEKAFGFEKIHLVAGEDQTSWHAEVRYHDQLIMFGKAGAYGGKTQPPIVNQIDSPINLYLYCEDVDFLFSQAVEAGAKPLSKPENTFWQDRMCRLQDHDGYIWCFATFLGEDL